MAGLIEFIYGVVMMVLCCIVEEIGKMFEGYFLYYEEYDWAVMICWVGYEVYY